MGRLVIVIALIGLACSSGCGPKVTPIGPGFVYQPDEREKRLWATSREQSDAFQASGATYKDPVLEEYLQKVLGRIIGHNENAYLPLTPRVVILDSPNVNAFAMPHGAIYVHTGLLGRIRNEAQLGMLIAHEITHSTHRHSFQTLEQRYSSTGAYSYISVLSVAGGSNLHNLIDGLSQLIVTAAISGYSREKEEEADRVGLTLLTQASYDPREGARMFETMLEAADKKDKAWNFFYSTHPKMESRVQSARRLLQKLPNELLSQATEVGEERYLDHAIKLIHNEVERHVAQGKFELAEKTLAFLTTSRPNDDITQALLGDLYRSRARTGDDERSKQAYTKALSIDSRCATAHKGLGFVLSKQGDKNQAASHLKSFLELAPNAPDSLYVRQYVEKLTGGN